MGRRVLVAAAYACTSGPHDLPWNEERPALSELRTGVLPSVGPTLLKLEAEGGTW